MDTGKRILLLSRFFTNIMAHESPVGSNTGLRSQLHADTSIWTEPINQLLAVVDQTAIEHENGGYSVLDGIYTHIGKYAPLPDTTEPSYNTNVSRERSSPLPHCEFRYHPHRDNEPVTKTRWVADASKLYIHSTNEWDPDCPGGETSGENNETGSWRCKTHDEERYCIGGLLVDPLVTSDVERAASHVETQLEELASRVEYLLTLERLLAEESSRNNRDHVSPVNVKGVGEKTTESLVKSFGVYSNISPYGQEGVTGFLSQSWGTVPDSQELVEQVNTATQAYRELHSQDESPVEYTPEDLHEYPKLQPTRRMPSARDPHHSW